MAEHLNESTDVVKSGKRLTTAIILNVMIFLIAFIAAGFLPESTYVLLAVFCVAGISTSFLLYQIIKRI